MREILSELSQLLPSNSLIVVCTIDCICLSADLQVTQSLCS